MIATKHAKIIREQSWHKIEKWIRAYRGEM